ncbi:MAG: MASE1 domain-containing protein, partial [Caldimonas sp.]
MPPATTATPSAGPPPVHWLHWGRPLALTTLACFIAGRVALALAIAPGFAAPVALGAGIGLACVLVYGRRMLFGVGIGALLAHSGLVPMHGQAAVVTLWAPLLAAAASALQAFVGAVLVHRFVSRPLTLPLPRDVAMFLLACLASSVVAPTLSAAFLLASSRLPAAQHGFTWLTWWVADLAGLLIATPIALTLIGRPNAEWAPRRMS